MVGRKATDVTVRYLQDRRARQRRQSPAGLRAHNERQVSYVTGNVEARDLASAVPALPEASDAALNYQAGVIDHFPIADEVNVRFHLLDTPGQTKDRVLFRVREDSAST
jgi:hypothetical protein